MKVSKGQKNMLRVATDSSIWILEPFFNFVLCNNGRRWSQHCVTIFTLHAHQYHSEEQIPFIFWVAFSKYALPSYFPSMHFMTRLHSPPPTKKKHTQAHTYSCKDTRVKKLYLSVGDSFGLHTATSLQTHTKTRECVRPSKPVGCHIFVQKRCRIPLAS